jgi:hypothetical protein
MKDVHDKSTLEIAQVNDVPAQTSAGFAPQGHARTAARVLMERDYRQRQGLITFLPVSMVAAEWGVSARRIRALLCAGRLEGTRHENGYWDVHYPYSMIEGRRGPMMRKYTLKKSERKTA